MSEYQQYQDATADEEGEFEEEAHKETEWKCLKTEGGSSRFHIIDVILDNIDFISLLL